MSRNVWLVVGLSLALVGCQQAPKEESQYDDARNPFYKQAQQDLDAGNANQAVTDYESALAADSKLAGAHYELGMIYGDKLNDPVGAIYHFKRYLAMAPNSDKAEQVKTMIDKETLAFTSSQPSTPTPIADDTAKVKAENAALKKQVDDATKTITTLQAQLAKESKHHHGGPTGMAVATPPPPPEPVTPPAPATPPASAVAPSGPVASADTAATAATPATPVGAAPATAAPAAPAAPPRAMPVDAATAAATPAADVPASNGPARSYKIASGDSLWKIAHKMYPGDTKNGIERIKDANKDILVEGKPLKIGQVLVIP